MHTNTTWYHRAVGTLMVAGILSITMGAAEEDQSKANKRDFNAAPKVGEDAPNFRLKRHDDESKAVELASFKGKKPVVLIFGSYT